VTNAAPPQIENLTETLQADLGLQQAQTFWPEDVVSDAIARLFRQRGNIERIQLLWDRKRAHELIDGFSEDEHREGLDRLRRVLDDNLVIQRQRDGTPRTFRPYLPELVTHYRVAVTFRELGRTVIDVLWPDEIKEEIRSVVRGWATRHPLAFALSPLTIGVSLQPSPPSKLMELLAASADIQLRQWVDVTVRQDWKTWIRLTSGLSADEQLESMTALVSLHLHVALLWRLRLEGESGPAVFLAVAGPNMDRTCGRAAYNLYRLWGERVYQALRRVASDAIENARSSAPDWRTLNSTRDLAAWAAAPIKGPQSVSNRFHALVSTSANSSPLNLHAALVDALTQAFDTRSGVVTKVRDFLRNTGRGGGFVGPDAYRARKRYQLDERALDLLARLHVNRNPTEILSNEEEPMGIDAFLDDLFNRYGFFVTREREPVRRALSMEKARPILRLLPGDEAMRRNRAELERRLDDLRLVRRYSDASAILHVV